MKGLIFYINIARIIASALSVAGGFIYLKDIISLILTSHIISFVFAVIFLLIIEIGSVLFLYISLKDIVLYRKISFLFIIPALAFMSLSFVLTTNGAVLWIRLEKDKTTEIISDFNKVSNESTGYYDNLIAINKATYDSIANVPLHKWKTARIMQTKKLQFYASEINRLQKEKELKISEFKKDKNTKIKENKKTVKTGSTKYYFFAFIIMLSVIYFNFMHVFLSVKKKNKQIERADNKLFNTYKKLEKRDVSESDIVTLLKEGLKGKDIAEMTGLHPSKISRIKTKNNIK
ncbi:MAG: hypothetical protein L3J56_12650 [Bacteroidales bacterium]|nr:hypothetical protein [Bacteroidales bacterium]